MQNDSHTSKGPHDITIELSERCLRAQLLAMGVLGRSAVDRCVLAYKRHKNKDLLKHVQRNADLKENAPAKRCFIIGNGPSIKKQDLHGLRDEFVFSCNHFDLSPSFSQCVPNVHMVTDPRIVGWEGTEEIADRIMSSCSQVGVESFIVTAQAYPMMSKVRKPEKVDVRYVLQNRRVPLKGELNAANYLPDFHTVVHAQICLAIYMGFSEIYLLGCDCTGFVSFAETGTVDDADKQYGFEMDEATKKSVVRAKTSSDIASELRWYASIFDDYRRLYDYCCQRGVKLVNLTEGGVLDCLPRMHLDNVLSDEVDGEGRDEGPKGF